MITSEYEYECELERKPTENISERATCLVPVAWSPRPYLQKFIESSSQILLWQNNISAQMITQKAISVSFKLFLNDVTWKIMFMITNRPLLTTEEGN